MLQLEETLAESKKKREIIDREANKRKVRVGAWEQRRETNLFKILEKRKKKKWEKF